MKTRHFLYLLVALSSVARADLEQARALLQQGHPDKALAVVKQVSSSDKDALQARFLEAQLLDKLGRKNEAIATYEALANDYPTLPEPHNNLAVLYAAQGQHNKARDALLNAINTHPSYATAYENLGNIYTKMAISAYNKALELDKQKQPKPISLTAISQIENVSVKPAPVQVAKAAPIVKQVVTNPTPNHESEIKLIVDTVHGWSNAWSAQNVDGYLAYYAPAFRPHNGLSRSRWEAQRRKRLRSPRFIRITIGEPDIKILSGTTARLTFEQGYESDRFKDTGKKVLLMEKINDQWQILREYNT